MADRAFCGKCDAPIPGESPSGDQRKPCPQCGSMARRISLQGHGKPTSHAKRQRAAMYLAIAIELRRLAKAKGRTPAWPYVRLFLRGRSLEVGLKAFLLLHNWTEIDVKQKLSHRLERSLTEARKAGLCVRLPSPIAERELKAFSSFYWDKRFEYFTLLELFVPSAATKCTALWRYATSVHIAILKAFLPAA
jgi:hypothetical protein